MPFLTKEDFKTHLYSEVINAITRDNQTIVDTCIHSAMAEVKSYLTRYDLPVLFADTSTDDFLKQLVKDVACWHLLKLANPNVNLELFRTMYEDAIKYLTHVQQGKVSPAWPYKPDDTATPFAEGSSVSWTSHKKRNNHF